MCAVMLVVDQVISDRDETRLWVEMSTNLSMDVALITMARKDRGNYFPGSVPVVP